MKAKTHVLRNVLVPIVIVSAAAFVRPGVPALNAENHRPPTTDYRPPTTDYRPPTTDHRLPTTDHRLPTTDHRPDSSDGQRADWADSVFASLTLDQKIGQLFAVPATGKLYNENDPAYQWLVSLVEHFGVGGIIFFRGEPMAQAMLTNDLQSRARVPLLVSQDMEWGVGMRLESTTEFPRAMSLGAARDPDLTYAMGRVVAAEARALGVHVNYAPVADVNNNPDNPVINVRSFGEDPDLVGSLAAAYVRGLQDGDLIATAKHFPGHGDTDVDSHSGLPVLSIGRERLNALELIPFGRSIEAGVGAIMIAHIALPEVNGEPGIPATLSGPIVTDILRNELDYDGLVVTDAMNMHGVTNDFGSGEASIRSLNAGVDQILMADDFYAARRAVVQAIEDGRIPMERVDQAVRRVLRAKKDAGLASYRPSNPETIREAVAHPAASALSTEIARRGITLVSNDGNLVPLPQTEIRILDVTLSDSDSPTRGRTFNRMLRGYAPNARVERVLLDKRSHSSEFDEVLESMNGYDLVLVQSYMIVRTGTGRIGLSSRQQRFLDRLVDGDVPVAVVAFGNPYVGLGISQPDAYIAAYGSSDATLTAVAQAITGQAGFSGKLPVTLGSFEFGAGIETEQVGIRYGIPEDVGMNSKVLSRLDTLLWNAIEDSAFPGAAIAIGRGPVIAKSAGYGYFTYESEERTTSRSLFDLASLTKVVATTPAIMLLYERDQIELDAPVATYLPEFAEAGKDSVTVRQILTHTSGLAPFYPFERMGITTRDEILEYIAADSLTYPPDSLYRYSDLGMIILAEAVERIADREFGAFLAENVYVPLGMHHTGFRPVGESAVDPSIVPTEMDSVFRKRVIQGEVHDERAWAMGGTAGHAGLFSTAEDLARYASMLVSGGVGNGVRIFEPETISLFTGRFENEIGHTRALGWDTKSLEGYSSAGQFFGARSFGHTGFTGTSMWIDPDANLFVILLTNRVYPTRRNPRLFAVRPRVADVAFLSLTGVARLDLSRFTKEPF